MNHWVAYFLAYYAVGLAWLAFNFASQPEITVKMLHNMWDMATTKWWGQSFCVIVIAFGVLLWPLNMSMLLFKDTEIGKRYLSVAMKTIRSSMDRPGLLEPQMPAPRCPVHDMALEIEQESCSACKATLYLFFCTACRTQLTAQGFTPPETGFMCDTCAEKS